MIVSGQEKDYLGTFSRRDFAEGEPLIASDFIKPAIGTSSPRCSSQDTGPYQFLLTRRRAWRVWLCRAIMSM